MSVQPGTDQEAYRDAIATVDASGKRNWIYPKRQKGFFYRWRTYLSWLFLAILFILPFIKWNGEPFVLLNILERRFIIFGLHFTPQDFHLFAILMITGVVFITLFTAIWGRLFCGWVCPQTVFMEMVFRKIEYWIEGDANAQRRLNAAPWTSDKIIKKVGKQLIFIAIAILIAHTFLSYIIGIESVWEIVTKPPSQNWIGFIAMVAFTGAFYFVFSYMREQVCIAICPYGRLQGVLLDNNSISVMYDWVRGEPRGKIRKQGRAKRTFKSTEKAGKKSDCKNCPNCRDGKDGCNDKVLKKLEQALTTFEAQQKPEEIVAPKLGDCIDCKLCVQVCPTGIDIRNGTQLECVNCTLCIDACDKVMVKINRPTGLIRYDSYNGIASKKRKILTPRVIAYSSVLAALVAVNVILLTSRSSIDALLLRTPGLLYQRNDDGSLNNLYNYQLINKTNEPLPVEFRLANQEQGSIRLVGDPPIAQPDAVTKGALFIDQPDDQASNKNRNKIRVEVWSNDQHLKTITTSFIRPPN
ncbi:MAG: 4Fe-4S dicluster domain-containing protein [Bacteroidota bacterium]